MAGEPGGAALGGRPCKVSGLQRAGVAQGSRRGGDGLVGATSLPARLLPASTSPQPFRSPLTPTLRLPVTEIREGLLAALERNDVCVVSGETGSGKTTQARATWLGCETCCVGVCDVRSVCTPAAACPPFHLRPLAPADRSLNTSWRRRLRAAPALPAPSSARSPDALQPSRWQSAWRRSEARLAPASAGAR